jgi:hypothetical protein
MSLKVICVGFLFMNCLLIIHGPSAPPHTLTTTVSPENQVQVVPKLETYAFVHHETTGITSFIIVNRKEKPIQFHADSDPLAVKSLNALGWRIFLPNARGKKLFLTRQYFPSPKHTPSCPQCPKSEEYREFKLVDWYITTPFRVVRDDCDDCAYLLEKNLRTRRNLELKDFQHFEGRDTMDIRRFQRDERSLLRRRI